LQKAHGISNPIKTLQQFQCIKHKIIFLDKTSTVSKTREFHALNISRTEWAGVLSTWFMVTSYIGQN
jgi:hypothetical protein